MKCKSNYFAISLIFITFLSLISCSDWDINIGSSGGNITVPRNTDFEAEEPFSNDIQVSAQSSFKLLGVNGDVAVTGVSGARSGTITGIKRVGSDSMKDAEDHLDLLEVEVRSLTNDILVETVQPQNIEGRSYVVDYSITLPNDLSIQVVITNGAVTVGSIENDTTVRIVNGNASVDSIKGSTTVSTVNGNIDSEVILPLNGTIDLNTVNGNIDLSIPDTTSAELEADISIGTISVSNLVIQNEVKNSKSLSGRLGNGDGTIILESEGTGDISISGF